MSSRENYASAGILGRELLASGPGFTHPGTPSSASPRSLYTRNIHIMHGSVFCFCSFFIFFLFWSFYPMIRGEILIYVSPDIS